MDANAEREIIEVLHEQLAVLRDQLAGARAREEFFQMLLTTDGTLDRESRLLALLEADRRELRELRELQALRPPEGPRHQIAIKYDASPRPAAAIAASRQPSVLHARILAALAAQPAGLTCAQVETALGTGQPLGNVLDGLARRGHITRLGKGVFGVAAELVDAASRNGTGP
jgi:hypothetical protein